MAFIEIRDFKNGLDTRRPPEIADDGALIQCINAHITRGGDIEVAKKFVEYAVLPAGTFGLHAANERLYVFGSAAAPVGLPGQLVYQRLQHPSGSAMSALLWTENFDGRIYAIAEYSDGSIYHFYNGARVTDWDTKAAAIADNNTVAASLTEKIDLSNDLYSTNSTNEIIVTSTVAGTPFTISSAVTGTGTLIITQVQANAVEVAEVRAAASFTVTGGFTEAANTISAINAGATALIGAPIPFVLDTAATALACANAVNANSTTHGYLASSSGDTVTILSPVGLGASENGVVLGVTANGFITIGAINNFSGGVDHVPASHQIEKITVGGTFAAANTYKITINSVEYLITGLSSGYSKIARAFGSKIYTAVRGLTIFSAVDEPTQFTTGTGIGDINISTQDQGSQTLTGFGIYQSLLSIFTERTVQIWAMSADPAASTFRQLLQNTGTIAPKTVIGYGGSDLLYLSQTGIRSLRARDSSNTAAVDDLGTRIDQTVIDYVASLDESVVKNSSAIVDPTDGRVWVAIGSRIFIFSFFPTAKISAWSYYEPGFQIDGMAIAGLQIFVRSGENIYVYGGLTGNEYPDDGERTVTVQLPFLNAKRLSGLKALKGLDIVCRGEWEFNMLLDPENPAATTTKLFLNQKTGRKGEISLAGVTDMFSPVFTSDKGGRLLISALIVHFKDIENN